MKLLCQKKEPRKPGSFLNLFALVRLFSVLQIFNIGTLIGQPYFSKSIDLGDNTNERIKKFVVYNDTVYASTGQVCDQGDCTTLVKLDLLGNIMDKRHYSWLDGGDQDYIIESDGKIVMSGHDGFFSDTRYLLQISTTNLDSLTGSSYGIIDTVTRLSNTSIVEYSDFYIIMGYTRPIDQDDIWHSHLFWIDKETSILDTVVRLDLGDEYTSIDEGQTDENGLLNLLFHYNETGNVGYHRGIIRMNNQMEIVSMINAPFQNTTSIVENMLLLNRDTLVIVEYGVNVYQLIFMNGDGEHLYTYSFTKTLYDERIPAELIRARNGDILGCGLYNSTQTDTLECCIGTGYIFRMSPQGELLWERIILELDSNDMYKYATFSDIHELDNGDILLGGNIQEENIPGSDEDMWFVRTDSYGCIEPNCSNVQIITSINQEQPSGLNAKFTVFPNPVDDIITVKIEDNFHRDCKIEILSVHGNTIKSYFIAEYENSKTIDVNQFIQGVYLIRLILDKKNTIVFKFVKY